MTDENTTAAVAELQSRLTFQEDTLQDLNKVIAGQDVSIARLQEQVRVLNNKLNELVNTVDQRGGALDDEPPPPHY